MFPCMVRREALTIDALDVCEDAATLRTLSQRAEAKGPDQRLVDSLPLRLGQAGLDSPAPAL
jgi:hypothetical protein